MALDREIFVDGVSTPVGFDLEGKEVVISVVSLERTMNTICERSVLLHVPR